MTIIRDQLPGRLLRTFFYSCLMLLVTSCTSYHYALAPVGGDTSWKPKPDSAVVLIGVYTDQYLDDMMGKDEGVNGVPSVLFPKNQMNVVALHRQAGESFQLEKVRHSGGINWQPYTQFDNLPVLNMPEPGLYYYGTVTLVGDKANFSADKNEAVINIARKNYFYLFNTMKVRNF